MKALAWAGLVAAALVLGPAWLAELERRRVRREVEEQERARRDGWWV